MSLRPRLIVGIGGSGGKTIRAMKESLEFRLRQAQIESLPSCWQFLQIDTTDDGLEFPAKMLAANEKCIVVRPGQTFEKIREGLEGRAVNKEERNDLLAGWAIPYSDLDVTKGAGMIRGIGNQVGIAAADTIKDSLSASINKLFAGGAVNELRTIAEKLKHANVAVEAEPQIMIVSSLAGGSGAGMFIDVVEILKRISEYKSEAWISKGIISFLYTAEVFGTLKGAEDIKQNCLGAVNEITGGLLKPPTSRTDLLMKRLAIGDSGADRIGTPINILIGSKNSAGVDIALGPNSYGMNEIFYTIGETLAALTLNPALSEEFLNKSVTNVFNSPFKLTDTSGFAPRDAAFAPRAHPFAAVGFARLSVGADRVLEFIRDGLLRSQVEALLWPETVKTSVLDDRLQTPEMMLEEAIDKNWTPYLLQSRLSERGLQNDVTDTLKDDNTQALITKFVDDVVGNVASLNQPKELGKVFPMLWNAYQAALPDFETQCENQIKKLASAWANDIQQYLTDFHAQKIAESGLRVTAGLIRKMISFELEDVIDKDLPSEIKKAQDVLEKASQDGLRAQLALRANGRNEISGSDRQVIDGIRHDFNVVATRKEEILRKKIAIELLRDLVEGFLQPLESSIHQKYRSLLVQYKSSDPIETQGIEFESLPDLISSSKIVPSRYQPRAVEKVLISADEYFSFYVDNAEKDLPTEFWKKSGEVFTSSVTNALLGVPLKRDEANKKEQNLITLSANWRPKILDLVNARAADFEMRTRFLEIRDKNRDWLADPDSKFGKTLVMNIRTYCMDGKPEDREKRQERFVKEYSEMLSLSAPLANYANGAFKVLKAKGASVDIANQFEVSVDPIPFDRTSESVGQKLDVVITSFLKNSGEQVVSEAEYSKKWFQPASTDRELFVLQLPLASLPAYAFGSLTNPIMESIMSSSSSDDWKNYWINRRTRPLPEAVPLSKPSMQSMIVGYYIAKLFGMISPVDENLLGSNFQQIASPALGGESTKFPQPLLQIPNDEGLFLGAILMSLGLAFVHFGQTGDEQHLHAYRLLQCLGREVTTTINEDSWKDAWNNSAKGDLLIDGVEMKSTFLQDWVKDGQLKNMSKFSPSQIVGSQTGTAEDRQVAIVSNLDAQIMKWSDQWDVYRNKAEWYSLPTVWEIRDEIDKALVHIRNFVKSIPLGDDTAAPEGLIG